MSGSMDYFEHCEFWQRATAEVTGLTAAEEKSFYSALTGQDSFGVLSARGEKESQPLLERIGRVSAT